MQEAIDIIKEKYVITGFKDLDNNGQQNALVIDNGKIVDKYTKCILNKGEKQKGKRNGEKFTCVDTKLRKVGIPICY